jgi:CHAT domain-containing protein
MRSSRGFERQPQLARSDMEVWEAQHARAAAMLSLDDGDLPGARRALDQLIGELTPSTGQLKSQLMQALIDRATVARFENDWERALKDLDLAAAHAGQLLPFVARPILTQVRLLKAKIYSTSFSTTFDLAKARAALDQLAAISPGHWMVEELESHIAFQSAEWDRAAAKALQAASLLEAEGWPRAVASCRRRAGDAFLELERLDEAEDQLSAAFDFFAEHGPPDLLSDTRLALARLQSRRLRHDEAWELAQRALDEVESRVRRFVDVREQQRFLVDKLRFYDQAFDIGLAHGTDVGCLRAWTVAERSKSFYLAHLLANADVPLFDGVDRGLVLALEALERDLDTCERKLGTLDSSQRGGPVELELESRLREISDERSAKLQSIMKTNPRWASLRNPRAFDAADLTRNLPVDVTPVSFFWRDAPTRAMLHVFARSAAGRPLHADVTWSKAQLDELARHSERLHGQVDEYSDLFPDGTIDRVLPPEVRNELPADACLLISAHGRLRGLPLHALPLDDAPLILRWPVQYVPSLGLPSPAQMKTPGAPVLLMGSSSNGFGDLPLKDVESELLDLEQIWKAARRSVIAKVIPAEATPEDAGWPPQKWSEFGVLHFACHGRFLEERPLDGALRLGRDAVRGSELFATKLNASVVALSACALGQRAERFGNTEVVSEEWIGLYLPLFYAGARSLVVSLWDANSQVARQFMVAFHQGLAQGEKPHVAFRAAMLLVRLKLPARWANWCLVGLPSDTIESTASPRSLSD